MSAPTRHSMDRVVLAIDVGTSEVRVALMDDGSRLLAIERSAVQTFERGPGWAEQDPEGWWLSIGRCCAALRAGCGELWRRVEAVGVTSQGGAAVCLDEQGIPTGLASLYSDQRALEDWTGAESWVVRQGRRVAPSDLGSRLRWLDRHDPPRALRTARVLSCGGYVVFRLTGQHVWDETQAAHSHLMDLASGTWDGVELARCAVDERALGPIRSSWDVAGHVTRAAAEAVGMGEGIPVVVGAVDFPAAALGAGVLRDKQAVCMLGSSVGLATVVPCLGSDPFLKTPSLAGGWLIGEAMDGAGSMLSWLGRLLEPDSPSLEAWLAQMDEQAMAEEAGARDLVFFPYVQGARDGRIDPRSRGALLGLTPNVSVGAIGRAVIEGVACGIRAMLDALVQEGSTVDEIVVTGGGARSRAYSSIIADVTSRTVRVAGRPRESSLRGCGLLALGAIGLCSKSTIAEGREPEYHEIYDPSGSYAEELYRRFTAVVGRMNPYPVPGLRVPRDDEPR